MPRSHLDAANRVQLAGCRSEFWRGCCDFSIPGGPYVSPACEGSLKQNYLSQKMSNRTDRYTAVPYAYSVTAERRFASVDRASHIVHGLEQRRCPIMLQHLSRGLLEHQTGVVTPMMGVEPSWIREVEVFRCGTVRRIDRKCRHCRRAVTSPSTTSRHAVRQHTHQPGKMLHLCFRITPVGYRSKRWCRL